MYDKIIVNFILIFVLLFSVTFTSSALAHKAKKHKPLLCIPKEERTKAQLSKDTWSNYFHRLSKLQQDCATIKILELEEAPTVKCGNIDYGHISSASTSLRNDNKKNAEKIGKIKKGDELLFIQESDDDKNWALVKVRLSKDECAEGFILAKFILKKPGIDTTIDVGTQLIMITEPKWKKPNKLIVIEAEGSISLTGAVAEGKIDKIVINDEEEDIQSYNSFTALLFIRKSGTEVRIVGYKNKQIKKKLVFTVKVGN